MQVEQQQAILAIEEPSFFARTFAGFRRWPYIPGAILAILVVAAAAAPIISPYSPVKGDLRARSKPPIGFGGTTEHILGTDNQGPRHIQPNYPRRSRLYEFRSCHYASQRSP